MEELLRSKEEGIQAVITDKEQGSIGEEEARLGDDDGDEGVGVSGFPTAQVRPCNG